MRFPRHYTGDGFERRNAKKLRPKLFPVSQDTENLSRHGAGRQSLQQIVRPHLINRPLGR
jgi:hypothetical protein